MKTAKKVVTGVLVATILSSVGFATSCDWLKKPVKPNESEAHAAFIEALGGTSETYTGAVSSTTYATASQAIEMCVANEVAGESASVLNTTTTVLSAEQVESLNLPASETEGMIGVDEVLVEYSLPAEGVQAMDTYNPGKTVKVYVIKFENHFKYYTPCPVTGETITQSYYDSVFDNDKYQNCTLNTAIDVDVVVGKGLISVTVDMTMSQYIKYSQGAIYFEQTSGTTMKMMGTELENTQSVIKAYFEKTVTGDVKCYVSTDGGEWTNGSLSMIGFSSIDELTPFANQYLDSTYFTKTDYGFELADENAERYVEQTMSQLKQYMNGGEIDMFAKYYVCSGVLSGTRVDLNMDVSMMIEEQNVGGKATAVAESKVTDYGTTVVEKPFD